ncbi:MAG: hypothetical protein EAZ76_18970 [Nostocales cyanobacterium]|nr:MAG: hypothetical protein EAZ87_12235 [Nostocales cyanobacterium]TAF05508.1 MAG: hypothetical protein EAZ76_18970 [Nostocales cyanobacterium]
MDSLQEQILTLSDKLDALYEVITNLDRRMSQGLSDCFTDLPKNQDHHLENSQVESFPLQPQVNFPADLEHKDVLRDGIYPKMEQQTGGRYITAEIQIKRLTAQLTAAYNRIAALEEQLMRQRIH